MSRLASAIFLLAITSISYAAENDALKQCLMQHFKNADANMTMAELRQRCSESKQTTETNEIAREEIPNTVNPGAISERFLKERRTQFDPYVITPHKLNYILPAIYTSSINKGAYQAFDGYSENLSDIEAKFQLSLKVPLLRDSLFIENDGLYFGFTLQSWWQVYAAEISRPFRETNYQPEIFYIAPLDWHPLGGNTGFVVGLEHQSNGREQILSRSWNRVYANFLFEKEDFALSFRPWVRINEEDKEFEFDPDGDDNPDIDDYMGHFELGMVYKWDHFQLGFMGRQNFATNKGAAELGLTFPLWGKVRGYASAFSGYGESLIDYNHSQTRFGIGIALNDIL